MDLQVFELPPIGTNAYLVLCPRRQEALLIDAPLNAYLTVEKVLVQTGYKLTACLLTHGHWDHMLDGHRFNAAGVPVYGHADDALFFENPASMARYAFPGLKFEPVRIDHWVTSGQSLDLLGTSIEVRHVPGHCPGNVLFWFREHGWAFVGDALFNGGVGRWDLPGGNFEVLARSIRSQIYTLPDATRVFPGHGPETTVADEAADNPYVPAG